MKQNSEVTFVGKQGTGHNRESWDIGPMSKTCDWTQFTTIRREVILKTAETTDSAGTQLAALTRLTYVSEDSRVPSQIAAQVAK
jgi:hypothetical protein